MKKDGNNWFDQITAKDILTYLCCAAVAYSSFVSANAVSVVEVTEIKRRLGTIEGDVQYLVRQRMAEDKSK